MPRKDGSLCSSKGPFTTIAPVLGTVEAPDGRQLTVADVPGLLEGAHEGVGLGDEFLAHLERARLFLHVIDATEDVAERFATIDRELRGYGAGLADRPQIILLNKVDLLDEAPAFGLDDSRILVVLPVSAATGAGVDELEHSLFELVPEAPPDLVESGEVADFLVYRPRPERRRPFRLFRTDGGYRVRGKATEDELRAAGVKPGDVISVKENSRAAEVIRGATEVTATVPAWLQADYDSLVANVLRLPERDEISAPVQEQLIVELYSK